MNPIETATHITVHHHRLVGAEAQAPADGGLQRNSGFAAALARQIGEPSTETTEPPSEEPAEPPIEPKPRKSGKDSKRTRAGLMNTRERGRTQFISLQLDNNACAALSASRIDSQ
jgi:hypothetical protein